MPAALVLAIVMPALVGVLLEKLAIEPVRGAEVVSLIIITIGASLVIRGLIQVWLGKGTFAYGLQRRCADRHRRRGAAAAKPLGAGRDRRHRRRAVAVSSTARCWARRSWRRRATRWRRSWSGIDTRWVLLVSFALSAALGAVGGILVTPITLTSYDVGHHARAEGIRCGRGRRARQRARRAWSAVCWSALSRPWRPATSRRPTRTRCPSC